MRDQQPFAPNGGWVKSTRERQFRYAHAMSRCRLIRILQVGPGMQTRDARSGAFAALPEIPRKTKEIWSRLRFRSSSVEWAPPTTSGRSWSADDGVKEARAVTTSSEHAPETLWEDGELVLSRGVRGGEPFPLLAAMPSSAQPLPETLARLQHAWALREELDPAWPRGP
jgi:hypothetical protein